MKLLSEDELTAALGQLPAWRLVEGALQLTHTFSDFKAAWAFLTHVALLSEAHNHHADIQNVYNRVQLRLWTHDAGGLTQKDLALATFIQHLLA